MTFRLARRLVAMATVCALASSSIATVAYAEPTAAEKETARSLMKEGRARRQKGDHKGALEAFAAADALMKVPTTGLEVGRSQADLGMLVEARDTFLRVTRIPVQPGEPAPFAEARTEAQTLATGLEARIPSVKLVIKGAKEGTTPTVSIDGESVPPAVLAVPRKVNPGTHKIVAVAGGVKRSAEVTLAEGETKEAVLDLTPTADDPPDAPPEEPKDEKPVAPEQPGSSGSNTLTWVGFGIAGAGLLAGSVTGLLAMSKKNAALEHCDGHRCPPPAHDDLASARSMATISTVSFVVALVGTGVGIYGLVSSRSSSSSASEPPKGARLGPLQGVSPWIGIGSLGVSGAF